jgi:hypothetical protein
MLLIALMIASPNNSWIGPPAIARSDPDGIGSEPGPCHGRATQLIVDISIGEVEDKPEAKPVAETKDIVAVLLNRRSGLKSGSHCA